MFWNLLNLWSRCKRAKPNFLKYLVIAGELADGDHAPARAGYGGGRLNSLGKACAIRKRTYAVAVTKLLQTAIEKLSKLPDKEQDVYAHFIIDELDAERQWEAALAGTQDQLAGMAEEAVREHEERRGLLGYLDFSE